MSNAALPRRVGAACGDRRAFVASGAAALSSPPFLQAQIARWSALVKANRITID